MIKNLIVGAVVIALFFAIHYRAATYDLGRVRRAWLGRPATQSMLLMRLSLVMAAVALALYPLGAPALPSIAFSAVALAVHAGAVTYVYLDLDGDA